jgi:DNA-binding protein H-NS
MQTQATLRSEPVEIAIAVEKMAMAMQSLAEWLLKQQQQLQQQQRKLQEKQQLIEQQQQEIEQLKEVLDKLKNRNSSNSSTPPSADLLKKPSDKSKRKKGKKRGPKYDHPGKTRNGFGEPDQIIELELETCPVCQAAVEPVTAAPRKVQQVAELIEQPVEIREYRRPLCQCNDCGWSGYSQLPAGVKEGFSYGGRLCSVVGWLGYGGNLPWRKQEYFVEHVLGVPISQGSLAKMQRYFQESLQPIYQQWLTYVQQPGVRCVDETTYCIDGIKYWLWVATSDQVCVLLLAPTRSSAELKQLLGEDFEGILSSDCFSAYNPQSAAAKQKCLTHLERDLEALNHSRFEGNRLFAQAVSEILTTARTWYRDYHAGKLSRQEIAQQRPVIEAQLLAVLHNPPEKRWPADAQRLANRIQRHWIEWFTFLDYPEVKPDNNDAERALRPVVVHRKVTGGARSDWGAQLVAQMFSFLETVRLQGGEAIAQLYELLCLAGRSPPGLQFN